MNEDVVKFILGLLQEKNTEEEIRAKVEDFFARNKVSLNEKSLGEIANWKIQRFASEEDYHDGVMYSDKEAIELFGTPQVTEVNPELIPGEGNILLNAGITALWTLACLTGAVKYDNTNAYLGVGDNSTSVAEVATQTALQGANKLFKAMDSTYPQVSGQTVTFQATFQSTEANWAWNEFGVANSSAGTVLLNRKVSTQGTKLAGQVWTLILTITLS
jgi:hypothetical protein